MHAKCLRFNHLGCAYFKIFFRMFGGYTKKIRAIAAS